MVVLSGTTAIESVTWANKVPRGISTRNRNIAGNLLMISTRINISLYKLFNSQHFINQDLIFLSFHMQGFPGFYINNFLYLPVDAVTD